MTIIRFFFLMLFLMPVCFAEGESLVEGDEVTQLSAAKVSEKKVEEAAKVIAKVKTAIQKEKKELVNEGRDIKEEIPERIDQKDLIREKMETLQRQEAAANTASEFLKQKVRAYERITAAIERKIKLTGNGEIDSGAFGIRAQETEDILWRLSQKEIEIEQELNESEIDIKTLKKSIEAKKFLLELKEGKDRPLIDSIEIAEQSLLAALSREKYLSEQKGLITLEMEVFEDLLDSYREKKWYRLKLELLTQKKNAWSLKDLSGGVVFSLILLAGFLKRKKIKAFIETNVVLGSKKMGAFFLVVLYTALALQLIALSAFVLGYGALASFVAVRLLYASGFAAALMVIYKLFKFFVKRFVFHEFDKANNKDGGEQEKIEHPYFESCLTLITWGLVAVFFYVSLSFLGIRQEGFELLIAVANRSLFSFGGVEITLQGIFKVVITVWLFVFASRIISNILSKNIYPRLGIDESIQYTISVGVKYLMFIIGAFVGLQTLGIKMTALAVFAGTVGIGIGFGLQDIAKNFVSGLIILFERPIKIGDYIEVGGLPGKVKAIKARSTIVDTFDNISVVVPNSEFMSQQVVNWSHSDRVIRVPVPVGVAYGSDVKLVRKILLEVADKHKKVLKTPVPTVLFEEFGDSSLNFKLLVWIQEPENRLSLRGELNSMIDAEFRKHHVTIPFPQRDLHFKSADVPLGVAQAQDQPQKSEKQD